MELSKIKSMEKRIQKLSMKVDECQFRLDNQKNKYALPSLIYVLLFVASLICLIVGCVKGIKLMWGLAIPFVAIFAFTSIYCIVFSLIFIIKLDNAKKNIGVFKKELENCNTELIQMKDIYNTERLIELKKLLDDKLITEEEFEAKKVIILMK